MRFDFEETGSYPLVNAVARGQRFVIAQGEIDEYTSLTAYDVPELLTK